MAKNKQALPSCRNTLECFHDHLLERFQHQQRRGLSLETMTATQSPWHEPSSCAILLEFRPLEERLKWSVTNALDNLPVPWCIQVAGSPVVLEVINASFPVEVVVGKIRLLDLGDGTHMTQVSRYID